MADDHFLDPSQLPDPANPAPIRRDYPEHPLPPYIRGGSINLLVGSHQAGKTRMLARLIADWQNGSVLGVESSPSTRHYFLSAGLSWKQDVEPRFSGLSAPLPHYCLLDDPSFDLGAFRRKGERVGILLAALDRLAPLPGSVVWVDPFTLFFGGSLLDHDACALACLDIHAALARRQLTIIGTAGAAKPKLDDRSYPRLLDRIHGTVAQLTFADTSFYLATPDELDKSGVFTLQVYARHAPLTSFEYIQDAQGNFLIAPPDAEFALLLVQIPEGSEVSIRDLMRTLVHTGLLTRPTLYRQLKALVEQGRLIRVRHGVYKRPRSTDLVLVPPAARKPTAGTGTDDE